MRFVVNVLELFFDELRIDLSRRNIGVAKHFLDRVDVRAVFQQMRREGVAERMRRDILVDLDRKSVV